LNGDITLLTEIPGDEKGLFFSRAAAKIRNEWKEGRLPDKTEWAS
jgi:hypothetical protein